MNITDLVASHGFNDDHWLVQGRDAVTGKQRAWTVSDRYGVIKNERGTVIQRDSELGSGILRAVNGYRERFVNSMRRSAQLQSSTGSVKGIKFGLDLDGVVANYVAGLRSAAVRLGLPPLKEGLPSTWAMVEDGYFENSGDWKKAHAEAFRHGAHHFPLIDSNAPKALAAFRDAGGVVVVTTARAGVAGIVSDADVERDTVRWLEKHGIGFDSLLLTHDKSQANCDVYLDDSPVVIEHLQNSGRTVIVRDQPYNRHVAGKHRVPSVSKALGLIYSGKLGGR